MNKPLSSTPLTFIYGSGSFVSGQRLASELLIQGLSQRGWRVHSIPVPLQERTSARAGQSFWNVLVFLFRLLAAWGRGMIAAFQPSILCVNLGQTRFALVRDGLPLLIRSLFADSEQAIVSLHGNLFASWDQQALEARLLRKIVSAARFVTVLGAAQSMQLLRLGIPAHKIVHVDNTCTLEPVTLLDCQAKQASAADAPLQVLFLSNLIESKGYPAYVRAIHVLADTGQFPMRAILCGRLLAVDTEGSFLDLDQAQEWLQTEIEQINCSNMVRLDWLNGAYGADKEELFRRAQIFVLPSRYKVEAQPLVLLEALASGCAVITTKVGEIANSVNEQVAILLDDTEPGAIAEAICALQIDANRRMNLACNGLALFNQRYSHDRHLNRWEELLSIVASKKPATK